jgi:hypothetical protein
MHRIQYIYTCTLKSFYKIIVIEVSLISYINENLKNDIVEVTFSSDVSEYETNMNLNMNMKRI